MENNYIRSKTMKKLIAAGTIGLLLIWGAGCDKETAPVPMKTMSAPKKAVPVIFEAVSLAGKTEKEVEKILGKHGDSWIEEGFEDDAPPLFRRGRDVIIKGYGTYKLENEGLDIIYVKYDKDTGFVCEAEFFFAGHRNPNAMPALKSLGIVQKGYWRQHEYANADGCDTITTSNEIFRGFRINYGWFCGELDSITTIEVYY